MQVLLSKVNIKINPNIYVKDPETSQLGQRIIEGSIDLIDQMGFEQFTFKKLGEKIGSPEASIYRYFESKHKLLLYLVNWYWGWMEYRLVFSTANIESPIERLAIGLKLLTEVVSHDVSFVHIRTEKLNRIVISESSKAYLTKAVDEENKDGAFIQYKQLVQRICDIILEINPDYKYPHMLVSTVVEGAHLQRFFAEHLPRLTDSDLEEDYVVRFYRELVLSAIEKKK